MGQTPTYVWRQFAEPARSRLMETCVIFGAVGCNFERVSKTRTTYDMIFRRKVLEKKNLKTME